MFRFLQLVGIVALVAALEASAQTPRYAVTNMSPGYARESWATGINNSGQVSACLWTNAWDGYGYVWTNGVINRMPMDGSQANAINTSGNVCGWLVLQGVVWNPNGFTLSFWGPGVAEKGLALNETNMVAGEYYMEWSFDPAYAFFYPGIGTLEPLAFPGQSGVGSARGINAAGHVTGWSEVNGAMHMFLYRDGLMHDCGLFPGSTETGGFAVTDSDLIIGYYVSLGPKHAATFDFNHSQWNALTEAPGVMQSEARAINSLGEIVGTAMLSDNTWHACRWNINGAMHVLDQEIPIGSGWTLTVASDINDHGQIVGEGLLGNARRAFLLTATGLSGDMNCDGIVSVADIGGFVLALTDPGAYQAQYPKCHINNADMNQSGVVTVADIGLFVQAVTGG